MKIFLVCAVLMSLAVPMLAQEPLQNARVHDVFQAKTQRQQRIAVVDMKAIFERYYRRQEMDDKLKKIADAANEQLENANDQWQKLKREWKKLDDNAKDIMLSSEERLRIRKSAEIKYREMKEMEVYCNELKERMDKKMKDNYDALRAIVLKEIQDEVQRRAVAGGYDIVLDKSGKSLNDMSVVIYASPTVDLTEEVLRELNKSKPQILNTTTP